MSFTIKLLDILSINATAAKDYIDKLLETKQNKLTFDDAPKKGSTNPVTSDGIRKAIDTATPNVDFSNYPTKNGTGAIGTWPISIIGTATKASQDSNGDVIANEYWHNASLLYDVDLNAIRKQGVYKQDLNAQSTAECHYPVNYAGALLVVESTVVNGFSACTQIYYPYNNNQAFQRKYDASTKVWSSWREYLFTDSSVTNATKASQDSNGNVIADTYETKADFEVFLDNCSEELIESYWETPQKFVFNKNDNMGPINLRVKDTIYVLNGYSATDNRLFDIERGSDCMYMYIDYDSTVTPAITPDLFKGGSILGDPDGALYAFFKYHQMKLIKESDNAYILWSSPYDFGTGGRAYIEWPKDRISAASPNCTYDNIRAAYMNGENLIIEFIPK